ncbi:MAG: undecaprenyl/decaprenyl-phosphate alpha-N-acetylglucosaminyl 1-phosphate transferase [Phycisphaerae bacterium]|nr:undecaprenyl/decaprenyl-phosphate alpha-N-acetylglucosaminyl 1-phosphate transferase [Phycisphaerae bacterium]
MWIAYIVGFAAACGAAMIFTPLVIRLAHALKLYDPRSPRKMHTTPTPRVGGIAVFASMMTVTVATIFLDARWDNVFAELKLRLAVLLGASAFIFLVGVYDDVRGLRAIFKLLAQIVAALAVCAFGIRIDAVMGVDWMAGWIGWPITVFWIIAITNAVNLIDGLDGLAAGICAAACAVIAAFSLYNGNHAMGLFMLILLGSLAGFLVFNFNPAKIFMGDGGSMFLGFFLATASLVCATKVTTLLGLAMPALALGLPLFDMFLSVVRRVLGRRSVFSADREHIHHRLVDMGLKHHHAVILMYVVTLVVTLAAMLMMFFRGGGELIVFLVAFLVLISVFRVAGVLRFRRLYSQVQQNIARSREVRRERQAFESARQRFQSAWTFEQWWRAVRRMARRMRFAQVRITYRLGEPAETHTITYTNAAVASLPHEWMRVSIPLAASDEPGLQSVQIDAPIREPLETLGRRLTLFGRLLDEHTLANLPRPAAPREPAERT